MEILFILLIIFSCFCIYKAITQHQKERTGIVFVYLGGHPSLKGPKRVTIQDMGDYLSFQDISLSKKDILETKLVPRSSVGSALAGAAVGGLLLGPIGALAGAAVGSSSSANVIQLTFLNSDIAYDLFFTDTDIINKYPQLKQIIGSGASAQNHPAQPGLS